MCEDANGNDTPGIEKDEVVIADSLGTKQTVAPDSNGEYSVLRFPLILTFSSLSAVRGFMVLCFRY